jgi:phage baseplate assembly protein W
MTVSKDAYLGQDLHLGFVADEDGRVMAGPFSHVDLRRSPRDGVRPRGMDLVVVQGIANLVQSLILRLKTEQGELEPLGHSTYGSRHHQLVGEPNTEHTRNLIKLYVLECLKQEPRIVVHKVDVKPAPGRENRDKVDITIKAMIKLTSDPLNLVVPFFLEGSAA